MALVNLVLVLFHYFLFVIHCVVGLTYISIKLFENGPSGWFSRKKNKVLHTEIKKFIRLLIEKCDCEARAYAFAFPVRQATKGDAFIPTIWKRLKEKGITIHKTPGKASKAKHGEESGSCGWLR